MNNIAKIFFLPLVGIISGCSVGPQASFSESMQDSFLFTSASTVSESERKCITLNQPFVLKSGTLTYSLPAGRYVAKKKNDTGYFYYAPTPIKDSSNWLISTIIPQGIYLNNQRNNGNLFGFNARGSYERPIRASVLPDTIFRYIQKNDPC